MTQDYTPEDVSLATEHRGDRFKTKEAVLRLARNCSADVRMIAAQSCIAGGYISSGELEEWLRREKDGEVRCYLYLAIAIKSGDAAKRVLSEIVIDDQPINERMFITAALSIAYSSRVFLLELMKYVLVSDKSISDQAVTLCKMLINEDSKTEVGFIEILQREAQIAGKSP